MSKRTELQLFKLYYNDVDIKRIREDLQQREEVVEQENAARVKIEEEIREKRRELGKLNRDQSSLEQDIKKCVSFSLLCPYDCVLEILIFFFRCVLGPKSVQEKTGIYQSFSNASSC